MKLEIATGWVKVFKYGDKYVFLSKEEIDDDDDDDDERPYSTRIRFEGREGIDVQLSLGFYSEEKRDEHFDNIAPEKLFSAIPGFTEEFLLNKAQP